MLNDIFTCHTSLSCLGSRGYISFACDVKSVICSNFNITVIITLLSVSLEFWIEEVIMILMVYELTQEKMKESMNEMQKIVMRNILIYRVPYEDLIMCSWQEFIVDCAFWKSNQNISHIKCANLFDKGSNRLVSQIFLGFCVIFIDAEILLSWDTSLDWIWSEKYVCRAPLIGCHNVLNYWGNVFQSPSCMLGLVRV